MGAKGLPKTGGRQKGSENKSTIDYKKRIEAVLQNLETFVPRDIKKLSPRARVQLWADLQEYIRPKLSRVQSKVEGSLGVKVEWEIVEPNEGK